MAHDFAVRAKRAYEWGRAKRAVRHAWIPLPILLLADCTSCKPTFTVGIGAVLIILTWFLVWRGGVYERAVGPATIGGLVAFGASVCASLMGLEGTALLASCVLGGVGAGAGIAWWSRRTDLRPATTFTIGAGYALLVGALGCTTLGLGALLGVAGGLLLTTPLLFIPSIAHR